LIAKSKCFEHDNPDHISQLEHLKHLDFYVNKADDVEYDLSQTIWNQEAILKLLQVSYPKGTETNNLDSFVTRTRAIPPQYDFSNSAVEQTFCDKILHLMKEVGEDKISIDIQKLLIRDYIKCWPSVVKTGFEKFILDASRDNITYVTLCLICILGLNTSWIKGADKKGQHEVNNVETKGDKGDLKHKYTDAVNTFSSENPPAVGSSSTSLCNVSNRLYHNVCPYFDWHPFANKDTKTPFLQSEKGKAYVEGHSKHYKMLDYKGMDTVTLLPNCPANFKMHLHRHPPDRLEKNLKTHPSTDLKKVIHLIMTL
jgi:hypothetical protein